MEGVLEEGRREVFEDNSGESGKKIVRECGRTLMEGVCEQQRRERGRTTLVEEGG
jgi:hypothetical protein